MVILYSDGKWEGVCPNPANPLDPPLHEYDDGTDRRIGMYLACT